MFSFSGVAFSRSLLLTSPPTPTGITRILLSSRGLAADLERINQYEIRGEIRIEGLYGMLCATRFNFIGKTNLQTTPIIEVQIFSF